MKMNTMRQSALQVSISLKKVELSVGESKFFICTAIGEPVRLEWFNPQGERIVASKRMMLHTESSRSKLVIYNAIIEDAGIYRCQATEAGGHTAEASVVLEIYQRLTFRDVESPQEFRHGETAEVVCDVISSPVPVVVWYRQDREITEQYHSRFQVLPNNNLQIHQVTKADEGVYRCEASVEAPRRHRPLSRWVFVLSRSVITFLWSLPKEFDICQLTDTGS
ncbi:hypothetical protein OJAV_G00017620 [Oryzias javanicus]|uniref:Ig-like domain-containing protein n=1 Tax=Oryzias javanicus TaxID=123683 RepID=A0A3S2Q0Y4_ORYJA|nr:hypothetical protein OJAV_G00017620 [Oryzias javanicus]